MQDEPEYFLEPREIRAIREHLGMSREDLADALMLDKNGPDRIRRWETPPHRSKYQPISGPAAVAIMAMLAGYRPPPIDDWDSTIAAVLGEVG